MKEIGSIIIFRILTKTDKLTMNKFCRQFYGYLDRSHKGKYQYHRDGFLDDFPHIKPLRGVLVVRKKDAKKIISYLETYNADIYARDIILRKEDIEKLM